MHRNWKAICGEQNALLRLLVSSTGDERILYGLQKGFPEFFQTERSDDLVPMSALRACHFADTEEDDTPLPERVLSHFDIPYFMLGTQYGKPYPKKWDAILAGKEFDFNGQPGLPDPPLYVEWNGVRCLVVEHLGAGDYIILVPDGRIDLSS